MEGILRVEFRESRVGNEMLLINGCKYMVNRRSGDTVYWRCIYSWCHSRAVFKAGQLKSARGAHICPQPLQSETLNENNLQLHSNTEVTDLQETVTIQNKPVIGCAGNINETKSLEGIIYTLLQKDINNKKIYLCYLIWQLTAVF